MWRPEFVTTGPPRSILEAQCPPLSTHIHTTHPSLMQAMPEVRHAGGARDRNGRKHFRHACRGARGRVLCRYAQRLHTPHLRCGQTWAAAAVWWPRTRPLRGRLRGSRGRRGHASRGQAAAVRGHRLGVYGNQQTNGYLERHCHYRYARWPYIFLPQAVREARREARGGRHVCRRRRCVSGVDARAVASSLVGNARCFS